MLHTVNGLLAWVLLSLVTSKYFTHRQKIQLWSEFNLHLKYRYRWERTVPLLRWICVTHTVRNLWLVLSLSVAAPSSDSRPTAQLSLRSDCTVPEGKPDLLVKQLLLQFNVGCSHKSLLALHYHFQHHPIQDWDIVLQLWMRGKYFSYQTAFRKCLLYGLAFIWHFSQKCGTGTLFFCFLPTWEDVKYAESYCSESAGFSNQRSHQTHSEQSSNAGRT